MDTQELNFQMNDWRPSEGYLLDDAEQDGSIYNTTARIEENQTTFELRDAEGGPVFGFVFEIDMGAPALHIDLGGGDLVMHIHMAQGGLVLTPDGGRATFTNAKPDRFAYGGSRSLLIK